LTPCAIYKHLKNAAYTAVTLTGIERVLKGGSALAGMLFNRSTICYPKHKYSQAGFLMNTIRILEYGQTQQYMQVWLTFRIWFLANSGMSPIQKSVEPKNKLISRKKK